VLDILEIPYLLGGIATAITISITYFFTHRKDVRTKYVSTLRDFTSDLDKIYCDGVDIGNDNDFKKTARQAARYARDYMNVLNKIAYLTEIGHMDKKTGEYFRWSFNYGETLRVWMKERGMSDIDFSCHWKNFDDILNKKHRNLNIEINEMEDTVLPEPLLILKHNKVTVFYPEQKYR